MDAKKSLWVGSVLLFAVSGAAPPPVRADAATRLACSNGPPPATFPCVLCNQPGRFPVSGAVDLPMGFTSSKIVSRAL